MSDPTEEATAPPAPDPAGSKRTPPGRAPTYIDPRQKAELLALVEEGKGVELALRKLGLSRRAYRNSLREDEEFADDVAGARLAADQRLEEMGFLTAQAGDSEFLLKMLERRDRSRFLNLARRDKRREQAEGRRDQRRERARDRADRRRERAEDQEQKRLDRALRLHLAELAAQARAKAQAGKDGQADGDEGLDLSRLTEEEKATLRELAAKIRPDGAEGPAG